MKIVYISAAIIPSRTANSVHVMKMCQAFVQNGHEVVLLAPDVAQTEPGIDDVYGFYGVEPCFPLIKLPWTGVKGRAYLYGLFSGLKARRLRPHLVYGRFLPGCFFSAMFGLPTVYEAHMPIERFESWSFRKVGSWMLSRLIRSGHFQRLVGISTPIQSYYQQRYAKLKGKVLVAPDGADMPQDAGKLRLGNGHRLQVGYVGHLYDGRGVELIVDLAKACPDADFHLVGGHEADIAYWQGQVEGLDNIFFHGFVPPAQTDQYRQAFDVLLAPYQQKVSIYGGRGDSSQWMSPLKIFEYMSAGKPILCSDLPVLREVLTDEETALMCDPESVQGWIAALKRLHRDEELGRRLGIAAQNEFRAKYTWKARAKTVLKRLPLQHMGERATGTSE